MMPENRVIIAGSREFTDQTRLNKVCRWIFKTARIPVSGTTIISGTCRGTDKMGEEYAREEGMAAISDNVPQVLAKTIESVKETTGFDLTEVMKANTYDAKVNNNINVATDFGEKITENAVKETTAEMHKNKIPSDSKDECFDYENM